VYVNDLSFDPRHPWFPLPGLAGAEWTVEVFTSQDVWGLDPAETTFDGHVLIAQRLRGLGGQRLGPGQVTVHIDVADGVAQCRICADHADQVKGVKLLIRGVAGDVLDAGWWTPTTPADQAMRPAEEPVLLTYPWENWQTPWACAGEGPGLVVGIRAEVVAPIRLYHYRPHWSADPVVEVVCDQLATRRSTRFEAPTIRVGLAPTREQIRAEMRAHLEWLESTHGLVAWDQRNDVPTWAKSIDLVVTLHGQHWTGYVFNTFDRMAEILEEVTEDIAGHRILAYLPGWEGRYYWQYPRYAPGDDLGGEAGFSRLMTTARRLGVHLMPMFGANGAHVGRYPDWEQAALRSPSNRYVALINAPDWDNDRAGEDDQVFLNPGEPRFRNHLVEQISGMVQRFGIEGVFLDTSACWLNDPRHEVYDGYVRLVGELRRRHPDLLVCGEGWYDALLALFPMNQTWLDMSTPPRFDDLPMRYSRVLGHLKDGAPGAGSTGVHEGGTRALGRPLRVPGYVPALSIVDDTLPAHREAVRRFCRAIGGDDGE
jgi:hypothetical protein